MCRTENKMLLGMNETFLFSRLLLRNLRIPKWYNQNDQSQNTRQVLEITLPPLLRETWHI